LSVPGQRQSISAASAVNAKGAFWFATYKGALTAELFIELLKKMMKGCNRPVQALVCNHHRTIHPPRHASLNPTT
jgi:hypothetical protein